MSESKETKLLKSLIWSTKEFPLAEFVERYPLPQVVCVEVGFFGDNESSTLSGGQVLTLHSLQQTTKVVCESPVDGVVVIPLHCPLKFRVLPKDCDHASVTADQLSTVYRSIKYIRVVQGHGGRNNSEGSLQVDDILTVRDFDTARGLIRCTNVAGKQNVFVPFNCDALFSPLLDPGDYTLAEVKKHFGFPAKVRFSDKNMKSCNDSSMSVSSLGTLTVYDEIEDWLVISTTMCGSNHAKVCLQIPKDLEITVVVAEGFMSGDETYQRVVKTLDQSFNRTSLRDFENLDVYEHLDMVKNSARNVSSFSVEKGSAKVQQLVMEYRSNQFTDAPSPKLPPRAPRKPPPPAPHPSWAPIIPPKPPPKVSPKPPPNEPSTPGSAVLKRLKSFNQALKSPNWLQSSKNRHKSEGDEPAYVEAERKSGHVYEYTGHYTALDPLYQSTENIYQEPLTEAPHSSAVGRVVEPVRPIFPPPLPPPSLSTKENIYQALARIPQDLSPLTTTEVGKTLTYLGMECYVSKFAHEMIDGEMLQSMDQESLESLHVTSFHIKKLLKFIGGWRPNV